MAHTSRCSYSVQARCRCSCSGSRHGDWAAGGGLFPVAGVAVVVEPGGEEGRGARRWLVDDPGLRAGLDHVAARSVRDEIARQGRRHYVRLGQGGHIVCGLLAEMAAARLLLPDGLAGDEAIRVQLMRAATATTVARVIHQIGTRDPDAVLTAVRMAAVAACPNPDAHAAVRQVGAAVGDRPSWAWRFRQIAMEAA